MPSSASTDHARSPSEAPIAAGLGPGSQHVDLAALLAQQPRHHQAVAAVVALADHDPDRPGRPAATRATARASPCPARSIRSSAGHALLLDRPRVHGAHLVRLVERGRASRGGVTAGSPRATAPAVDAGVGERDRHRDPPGRRGRGRRAAQQRLRARRRWPPPPRRGSSSRAAPAPSPPPPWRRSAPPGAGRAAPGGRVLALGVGEQALGEAGAALQGPLQAVDLEQVEADGHSTVTVLARLRGWSTFRPRPRAMWYASSCSGITASSGCSSQSVRGT